MSDLSDETGDAVVVDLGERLDVTVVEQVRDQLAEPLGTARAVHLDGARLEHVDSAGIQLLIAFMHAAPDMWSWAAAEPPAAVVAAAGELGLARALGLDEASATSP